MNAPNMMVVSPRIFLRLARAILPKRKWRRLRGRFKADRRRWRATLERCKAPGCDNLTDRDICDRCDLWVTEQVAKLDQDDDLWQDHCGDPDCEDCPPGLPNVQL